MFWYGEAHGHVFFLWFIGANVRNHLFRLCPSLKLKAFIRPEVKLHMHSSCIIVKILLFLFQMSIITICVR